jgi:hypothetical protein
MMATRADRALRERIESEARQAEGLRRDADRLNRRIWEESAITEALMRRIRLRWLGEQTEEATGDAHQD